MTPTPTTTDEALDAFLTDQRERLLTRTMRNYEDVVDLLDSRHCLDVTVRSQQPDTPEQPPRNSSASPVRVRGRSAMSEDRPLSWRMTDVEVVMAIVEYPAGRPFPGVIGRTADESSPAWPAPVRAGAGAPNVVFVVLDDTGFGQLGCYGSPIATPNFDALAASGLRFTNMHTTALCSPSRSCIVTGRNHHSNGMAAITELASGYPGYNGVIPFENGMLSEMLVEHGYNTFMVGKWHLTPSNQETAAGPYDRWPLARGFERFYGFLGGDTSQWYPDLVYDNHQVEPPRTPEEGYHLTEDLVDKSIEFIADAKPGRPGQAVLPAPVLRGHARPAPRPQGVGRPVRRRLRRRLGRLPGEGLRPAEGAGHHARRRRAVPARPRRARLGLPASRTRAGCTARMMEVFAGFLSHTDHHLGRLLDFLREQGELDNTIVMVVSDNGASAEGGPTGTTNEAQFFNNAQEPLEDSLAGHRRDRRPEPLQPLPVGLDLGGQHPVPALEAGDLPRRVQRPVHRVLAGAHHGARARSATQYAHIIDMVPTVLDLLGVEPPATIRGVTQAPLHGVSFAHTLDDAAAPTRHHTQYFEMLGHRAIDHDGWRAVCPWPGPSFAEAGVGFGQPISRRQAVRAGRDRLGAVPRRRGPRREPQPRRRAPGPADRADRHLVRRGRQVRGSCRSTAAGWPG